MSNAGKNKKAFVEGMRDGIPIAVGYFAVALSVGIAARNVGVDVFQGFLASALCMASAGEYALFTMIGAGATLLETALLTLIANARYFLMSCALSQKIDPRMRNYHRYTIGAVVTDEIFGVTVARQGFLEPAYNYGVILLAVPGWSVGTALGIIMGNLLPARIVSALSVALYGMFISVIIPPAKKSLPIALCVFFGFGMSFLFSVLKAAEALSPGTRTIILTVVISCAAALLFPVKEDEYAQ